MQWFRGSYVRDHGGCYTLPNDAWDCGFLGAPQTLPNAGITEVMSLPNDTWERGSKEHREPYRQV